MGADVVSAEKINQERDKQFENGQSTEIVSSFKYDKKTGDTSFALRDQFGLMAVLDYNRRTKEGRICFRDDNMHPANLTCEKTAPDEKSRATVKEFSKKHPRAALTLQILGGYSAKIAGGSVPVLNN